MGIPRNPPTVLQWMSTLSAMKTAGTRVIRTCTDGCKFWVQVDIDAMIELLGPDAGLHDERPPCPVCDQLTHFMASPGSGTPYRPLLSAHRGPGPRRPEGGWPVWPGER